MSVTITTITNDGDGLKATATLSGAPTGTPVFYQAERPEDLTGGAGAYGPSAVALDPASVVSLGGNQYRLTLVSLAHVIPWLWWLKVKDDTGEATEAVPWSETAQRNHGAVWLSQQVSAKMILVQVSDWLLDTLNRHRKALDAAIEASGYAATQVKGIQMGIADLVQPTPASTIDGPGLDLVEVASSRYDFFTVKSSIAGWIRSLDPRPETGPVVAFAEAVYSILRREAYRSFVLPSGLAVADAGPTRIELREWLNEQEQRLTLFRVAWEGYTAATWF